MILKLLVVFVVILAGLALYVVFSVPKTVRISRSVLIQASPVTLFPYISNSRLIQEWNPFVSGDPSVKLNYSGPTEGVGSQWSWEGKQAGEGQATIVHSEPNSRVSLRLDFKRPFNVTNFGEYALEQQASGTEVRWTINESALIPRVLSCFMNLDKMVGGQFETGLAKLKSLTEAKP